MISPHPTRLDWSKPTTSSTNHLLPRSLCLQIQRRRNPAKEAKVTSRRPSRQAAHPSNINHHPTHRYSNLPRSHLRLLQESHSHPQSQCIPLRRAPPTLVAVGEGGGGVAAVVVVVVGEVVKVLIISCHSFDADHHLHLLFLSPCIASTTSFFVHALTSLCLPCNASCLSS